MASSSRFRRIALPLAAFLAGLGLLLVAIVLTVGSPERQGSLASAIGGPFRLVDQNGQVLTERDFAGKPHLVFFGFTHCPDVCPTTLFQISEILSKTGDRGRDLRALFITVDPERDTPEVLKSYVGSFDPRIVALTGDRAAVDEAVKTFKSFARKVPTKDDDYTMEHTTAVYLMDRKGQFVKAFQVNREPEEAAKEWLSYL